MILMLGLTSCKLDPNWDVDALAPIAQTTLTPGNLMGDSNLIVQPGGDLVLDYETNVFDFPVDSLLRIPDSTYAYSFNSPINFTLPPGAPIQVYNDYLAFNVPDVGLSKAFIEGGKLRIEVKSTVTQPASINFQIPKAKKNGVIFSFTDNLAPAPIGGYSIYEKEFEINGYDIDFTGDNNDQYNKLRLEINATVASDAQPSQILAGQELIKTSISFVNVKPGFAKGKINTRTLNITADTVKLPFMDMVKSGTIDVDEVDLTLTVQNGFGVDARCKFDYITGLNTRTGSSIALNHPIIGNAINLNSATQIPSGGLPFSYSSYQLGISTSNSNLEAFAVNFPDRIAINGGFTVNPNGNLSAGNDFVFSSSSAKVNLRVVAPLTFSSNNLKLADTVNFNGSSLLKNNPIKSGKLKIYADNKFPFECGIKLTALDSLGAVVWSQPTEEILAAGIAQSDGRVYQSTPSTVMLTLSEQDFKMLTRGKKIFFEVRFHTLPTAQLMKIYHDYSLGLKVVAEVKAGI